MQMMFVLVDGTKVRVEQDGKEIVVLEFDPPDEALEQDQYLKEILNQAVDAWYATVMDEEEVPAS